MPTIDDISPNFRDVLLNRNIVSDTVEDNGLYSLLFGIGLPTSVETLPVAINPSNDIEDDGEEFQEYNLLLNKYKGTSDDYRKVDLYYLPSTYESFTTYLDKNGSLNFGGAATQISNIINNIPVLGGFDIRNSLAGRALTASGLESDSPIGVLGAKYLGESILANLAFNTLEETIGNINTNPLSLANGDPVILPSYKVTVPLKKEFKPVDILERITGAKIPVSLLDESSSIFTFNEKSNIDVSFISRANNMIKNTGKGQILALFSNVNTNTNPNLIGKRNGYNPGYTDDRISKGENTEGGTNSNIYAFQNKLNSNSGNDYPVSDSNYNISGLISNSGFSGSPNTNVFEYGEDGTKVDKYIWGDEANNKPGKKIFTTDKFKNPKTLLYKTQELFKSNKVRTLTSGKVANREEKTEIQSAVRDGGFMSKGSGVLSPTALNSVTTSGLTDENVFCRTWTTFDRYNQIFDLQKHSGINSKGRKNTNQDVTESVLEDTGLVRIAPYITDGPGDIKRFMFSIENLAWNDDYNTKLLPCEQGPGDYLTGKRGRIMWFPPYNISFNESVSVSWDKNDFIGRGEPIYTYNNTERTGSLSWQIVVDHPNYMNYFPKEWGDDEIASFFAGCLEMEDIRDKVLTKEEQAQVEVKRNTEVKQTEDRTDIPELKINFFFPNDVTAFPYEIDGKKYEDGLQKQIIPIPGLDLKIDYSQNPNGEKNGLVKTFDEKIVSKNQTETDDNTNFGLNGWKNINISEINRILAIPPLTSAGIESLYDEKLTEMLSDYFKNECKYCKINIVGLASTHVNEGKNTKTNADWFKENVLQNDSLGEKRFGVKGNGTDIGGDCTGTGGQETIGCKKQRRTEVTISYDANLLTQETEESKTIPPVNEQLLTAPVSRFFSECNYFRKMEQEDKFTFDTIREKIQYFHPGFHSITPEGFNSRLTFLHQCTRQGPTTNNDRNPDNLSFGRPPVCILRIGDFYHTKIIIDSLTIDYDPLVWDLNPEGIGVQPMIANITISFAFIGGSSLKGPINRLQNAISSNFYANTEIYDPRAEKIKARTLNLPFIGEITNEAFGYEIQEGSFPTDEGQNTEGNTNTLADNQEGDANNQNNKPENSQSKDKSNQAKILENLKRISPSYKDGKLIFRIFDVSGIEVDSNGDTGWNYKISTFSNNQPVEINSDKLTRGQNSKDTTSDLETGLSKNDIDTYLDTAKSKSYPYTMKDIYERYGPGTSENFAIDNCFSADTRTRYADVLSFKIDFTKEGETVKQSSSVAFVPYSTGPGDDEVYERLDIYKNFPPINQYLINVVAYGVGNDFIKINCP
jgi:hypothetical protein